MANNRERLVAASADLFHRQGYASTSLDDILTHTGIARSNFYYHFDSKLALARAVARYWIAEHEAELVSPSLGNESLEPRERIRRLFEIAAEAQDPESGRMGCPLGRLSTDLAAADPTISRLLRSYFAGVQERLCDLLVASEPNVPVEDAEIRAEVMLCVLEGGLLLGRLRQSADEIQRAGHAAVEMALPT